ncbi:hypothetical protein GW933_03975 [Candidatus Falkowbacteria bacterium]|uniref:Uncharacterized protein n=1 Tax=Candidatus Buchananbacteria bacterium CG10_big_fil_rev_8_21_14_0_10_33_19 TaxID=1974525 RepID=A0A2H0W5D4_9BACT|nr:hypothetical protein [Candidatus Falkowbacteria bacterium]PIS06555.1 MAG: hypothetical protein COT80_00340 [Candidatus Buchananbacteria bacterium CG10_big_fil_rev_8_21_14_0_10_33_19]
MIITRHKIEIESGPACLLVYYVNKGDQKIEVGRTFWSDLFSVLGAVNEYENGLLAALKFAFGETETIIMSE